MPKSSNQKLKLLYLLRILQKETDEEHYLNSQQLIERLEKYDISAERKSIYDDIARLTDFGYDIIHVKTKGGSGYYMGSREFELAELKLLVDVVQASRFITLRKSRELINKLEQFVSGKEAQQLQRQVYVAGRVKTDNESIYYNVDFIHRAIQENRQISFQYMEWTLDKKLVPRKGGARYVISPWALSWNDENYYLIGYDSRAEQIRHYRVDKMLHILLSEEIREGKEEFQKIDMASYSKKSFGMFGGKEQSVKLLVENSLAGVIVDRFGKDVMMIPADADHFTVSVDVQVSSQFISWVFALGSQAKIVSPKNVVNQVRKEIEKLAEQYALPIENRREN